MNGDALILIDNLSGETGEDKLREGIRLFIEDGGRTIKGVTWSLPITITDTVEVPAQMIMKPAGRYYGPVATNPNLKLDLNDPEKDGFVMMQTGGRTPGYAFGQHLENLNIRALSPCRAMIAAQNGSDQVITRCTLDGRGLAGSGIVMGLPEGEPVDKAVNSEISSCLIVRCKAGVTYVNCGMNHTIEKGFIRRIV